MIIGAAVAVVAIGSAIWWWATRSDTPAAVTLADATASVSTTGAGETPTSFDGRWTIDDETGTFDYQSATGTFAGFRIDEELAGIGATQAVGRTGEVAGSIEISGTTLEAATFEIDLRAITTDDRRRDDRVQSAIDTSRFPSATFTLTEPVDLGPAASTGGPVSVTAVGDVTIRGITRSYPVPIEAQVVGDTIVVIGSFEISFSDFDVTVPRAAIVLSVADTATLEFQLLFTRS